MELDARRLFLSGLVVSLVATAAIAIATLLLGEFGETEGRILLTTASISLFSLLSLPGGVLLEQGRRRGLAVADLVLAALGLLVALWVIWIAWDDAGDAEWKSLVVVTSFALATTQAASVESRRRDRDPEWVVRLALVSHGTAAVTAAMISAAALWEVEDDGYYRALGALAVANVLLVALQPVLRRMSGAPAAAHRFVCVVEGGRRVECERAERDFAGAVASAIRELERAGNRVVAIERS